MGNARWPLTPVQAFGGGPLGEVIGNQLVDMGIKLRSIYGATEFGAPSRLTPTHEEDWKECGWVELDTDDFSAVRFGQDRRLEDVARMLRSSGVVSIKVPERPELK